jgi:membrane protein YqaA with SNARE-associated domain
LALALLFAAGGGAVLAFGAALLRFVVAAVFLFASLFEQALKANATRATATTASQARRLVTFFMGESSKRRAAAISTSLLALAPRPPPLI